MKNNIKGGLILGLAAIIWGFAFVAQNEAKAVPSFLINSLRSFISVIFLAILYKILNSKTKKPFFPKDKSELKTVISGGVICGICLTVAANFQQFGISFYKSGQAAEAHAGFLTALYVVIVPIISVFFKKKIPPVIWVAVSVAIIGFYFLCLKDGLDGICTGDYFVLLCALSFSFQIIMIDKYVDKIGGVRLSLIQFATVTVLSGIMSLIFERSAISFSEIKNAALPILYLGIMSSGVAYTLQIIGQKYAEPAIASITMSLESVFAAIGGAIINPQNKLSLREIFGCGLVFSAIIIAQLPEFLKKENKRGLN